MTFPKNVTESVRNKNPPTVLSLEERIITLEQKIHNLERELNVLRRRLASQHYNNSRIFGSRRNNVSEEYNSTNNPTYKTNSEEK